MDFAPTANLQRDHDALGAIQRHRLALSVSDANGLDDPTKSALNWATTTPWA